MIDTVHISCMRTFLNHTAHRVISCLSGNLLLCIVMVCFVVYTVFTFCRIPFKTMDEKRAGVRIFLPDIPYVNLVC